jgi:hypothetical protein
LCTDVPAEPEFVFPVPVEVLPVVPELELAVEPLLALELFVVPELLFAPELLLELDVLFVPELP